MNYDDSDFELNLKRQLDSLSGSFAELLCRHSLYNKAAIEDVKLIHAHLPDTCRLLVVVDCGWIPAASYADPAKLCIARVKQLKEVLEGRMYAIAVCATTFPNNVSEMGNDAADTFALKEIDLFEEVQKVHSNVIYGDYGSINPVRNDQVFMARGWIPRVDVPLEKSVYYYRERKGARSYADTYTSIARMAVRDSRFPSDREAWFFRQIENCALGDAPSSRPSFWISVRMNAHIAQQIDRLGL